MSEVNHEEERVARRPAWLPQIRQFSQKDMNTIQRPEGLDSNGAEPITPRDVAAGNVERYSTLQVSPARLEEFYAYTAAGAGSLGPVFSSGGEVVAYEKDCGFNIAAVMIDNWTNQWLYLPDLRRFVPAYSGGWVFSAFKQFQKIKVQLRAPSAFAPAAALAGEFIWGGASEAFLPPQTGIITTVKAPVVV